MTRRILVIDDEERIRVVVQVCLEELAGWNVVLAESGEEGIAYAKAEEIDAILLDVSMPDLDGVEVFRLLQSDATTCNIPVILLTAKTSRHDRASFIAVGVTGVLAKPFDALTLPHQIAEILGWAPIP
ncbi:response regulator [Thermocoleostomius sinensis]|uniref:Response regulator n=1 Tax=Thermocoleostomius sinensis A174 TaxID=2016057 RepID=A0A9E8Z841_9CYAN|nr:response regulator [Thermocoleostomius sinensis]WAL58228.1 response regulator [Thermocoleostomius sinensis A174]